MDELEKINPHFVQIDHIGDSWQERPLKVVKVCMSLFSTLMAYI